MTPNMAAQAVRTGVDRGQIDWGRLSLAITLMLGLICGIAQATGVITRPYDFDFYWHATNFSDLYPANWLDQTYAYVYPPVLAQVLYPLHLLPYAVVQMAWTTLCFASLWICLREWSLVALLAGFVGVFLPANNLPGEWLGAALVGNMQFPIAAAIVLGMRLPGMFAVPILTKLTVGVGVLWFAFRREWRRFATAIGVTAVVVVVSALISPGAWLEWLRFSIDNYGGPSIPPIIGPPLPLRLIAAVVLVAFAARSGRAWLVPLACGIAVPGLYGLGSVLVIASGSVALATQGRAGHRPRGRPATATTAHQGSSPAKAGPGAALTIATTEPPGSCLPGSARGCSAAPRLVRPQHERTREGWPLTLHPQVRQP
jgi:hypothetical protein